MAEPSPALLLKKLVATVMFFAFAAYAIMRSSAEERAMEAVMWLLFIGYSLVPFLLAVEHRFDDNGLAYKRLLQWKKSPWHEVHWVGSLPWFPWDLVIVAVPGGGWPFCWIVIGEDDAQRVSGKPLWCREGTVARTIKRFLEKGHSK